MPTEPEANAGTPSAHGELLLADKPEEHIVWQRGIEPLLMWVSDNARRICAYGFTEMLNNAIDHSEGTRIRYFMDVEQRMIRFTIRDDGIGVFEKIRSRFKLEDHRLAMLELSKGKLTTDSSRHSGQGIFFTSRMFDYFLLGSNGLSFSHTAGADDWLIETGPFDQPGTVVIMEIQADSRRTTRQVFDMFADPDIDDYRFSRTHVPLKLARFGASELVSRSEAKRVLARFEGFREVLLDFDGIESIGQAFADEIFRVFRLAHPEINVIAVRENEPVRQMVDRARASAGAGGGGRRRAAGDPDRQGVARRDSGRQGDQGHDPGPGGQKPRAWRSRDLRRGDLQPVRDPVPDRRRAIALGRPNEG